MSERFEFPVGQRPSLDLRAKVGSVEIVAAGSGLIAITVDQPDRWRLSHVGDAVVMSPNGRVRRGERIAIEVPRGARVDVRSTSADLRVEGDLGATSLVSATGDFRLNGRCESLQVSTASGDLRCLGVDTDLEATTVSGDVYVDEVGGRVEATTTSGDVRLGRVGGDITLGSTSGDVRVQRAEGTEFGFRTISGDVRIGLPTGIRVCPELTTFSGTTRLPEPRRDTGEDDERPRRLVRLTVKSVSGDIDIQRADHA